MAKTSAYVFTNTAEAAAKLPLQNLGLATKYAITGDSADVVTLDNKTAPLDAQEIIQIRSRRVSKISTPLNIQHPAPVAGGIEYSIRVDDTLRTTDSADPNFVVDEPITCTITIRHPRSGNFTNETAGAALIRAVSAFVKADKTWRFEDLMRSQERPYAD